MNDRWVQKERPERAPDWCSIDLCSAVRSKSFHPEIGKQLFAMLVSLGVRDIALGTPANSAIDFAFLQTLKQEALIPDHVRVQVRTAPDEESLRKTLQALDGIRRGTVQLTYRADGTGSDTLHREKDVLRAVKLLHRLHTDKGHTEDKGAEGLSLQHIAATATDILPEVTMEITGYASVGELIHMCEALRAQESRLILSFEEGQKPLMSHVFASCLEEITDKIRGGGGAGKQPVISVRPHKIQTAMLSLLAGATRMEGVFFGEESGEDSLLLLAKELTAYGVTHGLQPEICARHADRYFPSVRHSGEASDILDIGYGIVLPEKLRDEFETAVKIKSEKSGHGLQQSDLRRQFEETYVYPQIPFEYRDVTFVREKGQTIATVTIDAEGKQEQIAAGGNGLLDAVSNAYMQFLGIHYQLETYEEHSLGTGSEARALSFVSVVCNGHTYWGAGISEDISRSSIAALSTAVGRLCTGIRDEKNADSRIDRILNYIKTHYKSVTLDELSGVFFLSKPYLSKYIKEKSGLTFGENVKRIRLQKAKTLLKNGNMKIEQVAGAAGYPNVEHFNRMFKKEYGCTPVQYREK